MSEIGEEEGNMSRAALTRAERLASVPLWSMHKYSRSRGHLCLSTCCGVVHARKRNVHQETCSCDDGALDGLQSDLVCIATSARWWRVPWREMRRERSVGPPPQPKRFSDEVANKYFAKPGLLPERIISDSESLALFPSLLSIQQSKVCNYSDTHCTISLDGTPNSRG